MKRLLRTLLVVCPFVGLFFFGMFSKLGPVVAASVGAAFAVAAGFLTAKTQHRGQKLATAHKPEYEREGLLQSFRTAREMPRHQCRGWLYLTKQRIVFDSTGGDLHHVEIPLADIAEVHARTGPFNHRLEIVNNRGETHRFALPSDVRAVWAVAIEQAIEKAKPGTTTMADEQTPVEQACATATDASTAGTTTDETIPA